jgi:hypothetical protein
MQRTVFFISDGTGITAETLGHSLLTQFDQFTFEKITIPYVDTAEKAQHVIDEINVTYLRDGNRPLIFATLIDPQIRTLIATSKGMLLDFFKTFLDPLEAELQTRSSHSIGRMHGLGNYATYMMRINALNYTLGHDDGLSLQHYGDADLILVGVSRCGKTPTCLYLALQFGILAANYPLTQEDIATSSRLPKALEIHRHKLFGLTIDPERLHIIRSERKPDSTYASRMQCQREIQFAENIFKSTKIPYLNSTTRSIEEIATTILTTTGIKRRL